MKNEILYNNFLEEIAQKIPQKTEIVNILSEILCIDKADVYKRLKGEVELTFSEAKIISGYLGISLDNLAIDNALTTKSSGFSLIEYINPTESGFALLEEMTAILKSFDNVPGPQAGEVTNILPQPIYMAYDNIFKFYLFLWKYQFDAQARATPYKDITIIDRLQNARKEYVDWAKRLHAEYIFDHLLFHYLINDIKYFYQIGLITAEDIQLIQQDLLEILDDIDDLSDTGIIKETGKSIRIYISDVNIGTNYIFISAPDYQLTIVKAFLLNGIASTDKKTFDKLKHWMKSVKQQSVLITGCGEKERIDFLEKQRKLVGSLSQL